MHKSALTLSFLLICSLAGSVSASQLVDAKIETKLVPSPVEYAVLLPDGYEAAKDPLPLLLFLHGGGGDRGFLTRMRSVFDEMWKAGTLPPIVVVTPSAARSFYMDYKDGSQFCGITRFRTNIIWCAAPITSGAPFDRVRWKASDFSRVCSTRHRPIRKRKRRANGSSH
jgi:hypothetical protein